MRREAVTPKGSQCCRSCSTTAPIGRGERQETAQGNAR
jgi:hypothetical protein